MHNILQNQFLGLGEKIIGYLPYLFAGIVLVAVGWFLGWLAKRVVIQIAVILRLERFLTSFRWGKEFSRADVRYGLYRFLGNIAYLIVFLIFLNNALTAWKLTALSKVLEDAIYFFPRTFASLAIFGIGWLIASWASKAVQKALRREEIPRATLIARFIKAVLLVFFSAMALFRESQHLIPIAKVHGSCGANLDTGRQEPIFHPVDTHIAFGQGTVLGRPRDVVWARVDHGLSVQVFCVGGVDHRSCSAIPEDRLGIVGCHFTRGLQTVTALVREEQPLQLPTHDGLFHPYKLVSIEGEIRRVLK